MEKVDTDISLLQGNGAVASTASTLGQVLKSTKNIMDQLSKAHPILNASWTIISSLYQVNCPIKWPLNLFRYYYSSRQYRKRIFRMNPYENWPAPCVNCWVPQIRFLTCPRSQIRPRSSKRSAASHYKSHRSYMNIRNCISRSAPYRSKYLAV
ncbi:hypothetical protein GALMADRAFT_1209196 [Galerina marginata CBS 339.88]|uniref:Uncharacterized protein n=1 Tax=Galerina marginata (strain CBS 339.88) TaxID=685588 RepID=A0A067S850_GALM3|nr:hypothetical protein GALMADRAFT_1209196 [Galerina marginata CBS 339.88]